MPKRIDISNQRFGRLIVVERKLVDVRGQVHWFCKCDCGGQRTVHTAYLRNGRVQSCGCLRGEIFITHGHARNRKRSPEYQSWLGMKVRCSNPNSKDWKDWGGRGIKVCERWHNSFENFLADMGPRSVGYSLDRIDVNGNYEPGNCQWLDSKKQARNRRNTIGPLFSLKEIRSIQLQLYEVVPDV